MKKIILMCVLAVCLVGCNDADVASRNISRAADQFEVARRVVFYNGITGEYILTIEGFCATGNGDPQGKLSVVCKDDSGGYKKHYLGLSDNVTYFAEQIDSTRVSASRYRVIFKPSVIIPDMEIK